MDPAGIERHEPKSLFFWPCLMFLCQISDIGPLQLDPAKGRGATTADLKQTWRVVVVGVSA